MAYGIEKDFVLESPYPPAPPPLLSVLKKGGRKILIHPTQHITASNHPRSSPRSGNFHNNVAAAENTTITFLATTVPGLLDLGSSTIAVADEEQQKKVLLGCHPLEDHILEDEINGLQYVGFGECTSSQYSNSPQSLVILCAQQLGTNFTAYIGQAKDVVKYVCK